MANAKEQANKAVDSLKKFWAKQEKKNKIIYISSFAAVLIILVIIIIAANHKDEVVLFTGLETSEASEIVAIIEDAGYECTLTGGTITVPEGTENTLIMSLAQQGYPKSSGNYEFYTSNVGMFSTESENKEYKKIALEDRFSAIIGSLTSVEKAEVTLYIPEKRNTVIADNRSDPTASVVVYLKNDSTLSNAQINGITHIVTKGCENMTEENVSIIDQNGVLLVAEADGGDVVALETRKLRFKASLENQIKDKIIELLTPAYNEDGFSVAVNMVLNFDEKVSEDTVYTPSTEDGRGMLQEGKSENATGYATADGGIVGVEVNADDTYPTGDTNGNGSWSESSLDNIYLVNTYKEQIEKEGYTIDSLSVSTIIYTDYLPDTTKQDLVSLIGNAASINPEVVNDVVTVTSLPKFGDTIEPVDEQTYLFGLTRNQLIILAAILLGMLLILIIILVAVSGKSKKKRQKFEQQLLAANVGAEQEPLVENFYAINSSTGENIDIPSLMNDDENSKELAVRREIATFARQRPEIVAQLIRNWMNETPEDRKKENEAIAAQTNSSDNGAGGAV